jgi:addiction module HigA family antidote
MTTRLPNIHPGEMLKEDFLDPYEITPHRLAQDLHVPATRISEIVKGRRAITADTALRLAQYFQTTKQFWMNLQDLYEIEEAERDLGPDELSSIRPNPEVAEAVKADRG